MPHDNPDEMDDPDAARASAQGRQRAVRCDTAISGSGSFATPHTWAAETAALALDRRGHASPPAALFRWHPICVDLDACTTDELVSPEKLASRFVAPTALQPRRTQSLAPRRTFTQTSAAFGAVLRG